MRSIISTSSDRVIIRHLGVVIRTTDIAHYLHIGRLTLAWAWCHGHLSTLTWFAYGRRWGNGSPGPGFTCRLWRILVGLKLRLAS